MKKKSNGITLVALVITIILLLIFAGISISALTNTGIFQKAVDAKNVSENAEKEQGQTLGEYEKELNRYMPQELTDDKINKVLSKTENTFLKDTNGNIFTLPAGFKMVVNEGTNNAKTVDKGIVIEDATVDNEDNATATNGSQFVWVPVGKIYTDKSKTEEKTKTITLGRYDFYYLTGEESEYSGNFTEEDQSDASTLKKIENKAIAKNITNFKNSVETNGGYYIGRYEARTTIQRNNEEDALTPITEKGTDQLYNYVTQQQAASQAQNMYNSNKFKSDLINSYAWDTAIIFIQKCTDQNKYSYQNSLNQGTSPAQTGTINDKQCNIFDMASNVREWTTETSAYPNYACVNRGGDCYDNRTYMSNRYYYDTSYSVDIIGFRPILYL